MKRSFFYLKTSNMHLFTGAALSLFDGAMSSLPPSVELKNAAQPGTFYPAVGMGTGCAIGGCTPGAPQPMASLNMSLQWLALGGRRFDGADSYGIEPGIGAAIQRSGVPRDEVFIVSKTGPGGLAWPLGYNETLQQASGIVANYSTSYVDLMLIHWPVNYGPCSYHGPPGKSIPTTDKVGALAARSLRLSADTNRDTTPRTLFLHPAGLRHGPPQLLREGLPPQHLARDAAGERHATRVTPPAGSSLGARLCTGLSPRAGARRRRFQLQQVKYPRAALPCRLLTTTSKLQLPLQQHSP
jgi:hypothetical protein